MTGPGGGDDVRRVLERAYHLEQVGRDDEAESLLATTLASHPEDPDLHRELARHVLSRGGRRHHAEGLRLAGRAVELDPADPWNLLVLGTALTVSPT